VPRALRRTASRQADQRPLVFEPNLADLIHIKDFD
jgi:hypothetical protein